MTRPLTELVYLSSKAVRELMPRPDRQLELVRTAYEMLESGQVDMPATPEIAPRAGSFVHAMPCYVGGRDITALKWIGGFPENRDLGLPYLSGLIVVNESDTGLPIAVLDCLEITAARTAAVSVVCIQRFLARPVRVIGIIGYGVQTRAHISLIDHFSPDATVHVYSRRGELGDQDRHVTFVPTPRDAVDGADVVITAMPLETPLRPRVSGDWLKADALVLPLDDDASLDASVANTASTFYVDDLDDFRIRVENGHFSGWRSPDDSVARAVLGNRDSQGLALCANQGIGLLDALFANDVLRSARERGVGVVLER